MLDQVEEVLVDLADQAGSQLAAQAADVGS
jgi:hypothetical protein